MKLISSFSVPIMIAVILFFGVYNKIKVYDTFLDGVKDGMKTTLSIAAPLIALITAVSMFRASGALALICHGLEPLAKLLSFPAEVLPLAILRPISGSASLALVKDIVTTYGPDSFIGRVASVISGSTETTFYTLAVYFGAVKINDSRHTLKSGLLADATSMIIGTLMVHLLLS
jgi:spore maturation protein B